MFTDLPLFPDLFTTLTTADNQDQLLLRVLVTRLDQDVLDLIKGDTKPITHVWHLLATERNQYQDTPNLVQAVKDKYGLDLNGTLLSSKLKPFLKKMVALEQDPDNQEARLELLAEGRYYMMTLLMKEGDAAANIGARGGDTYEIKQHLRAIWESDEVLRRVVGLLDDSGDDD